MNKKMTDGLRLFAEGLIELCAAADGKPPIAAEVKAVPLAAPAPKHAEPAAVPSAVPAPEVKAVPPAAPAPAHTEPEALTPEQLRKCCANMLTDLAKDGKVKSVAEPILYRFAAKLSLVPDGSLPELYAALGEACPPPF